MFRSDPSSALKDFLCVLFSIVAFNQIDATFLQKTPESVFWTLTFYDPRPWVKTAQEEDGAGVFLRVIVMTHATSLF